MPVTPPFLNASNTTFADARDPTFVDAGNTIFLDAGKRPFFYTYEFFALFKDAKSDFDLVVDEAHGFHCE
jgi:hypothetical protein